MASVTIELPALLAPFTGGARQIGVEAATLEEAIAGLLDLHPALRGRLFDEEGRWRRHVLCFHDQTYVRWLAGDGVRLAPGDQIVVIQAVSGG
jgi:adenylyltransferase/sulfurtransferase